MSTATQSGTDAANPITKLIAQLRSNPKLPLIIGGALAITLISALWLWNSAPTYRVLFSNLSDRDGGAVIASLQQMNIPYKYSDGGSAVLVEASQVHDARFRLAAQGLPKGGSVGFELMETQKFGTSQFAEQVNYQRALEGEIAQSIESIASVVTARVHLAIPKPSLFVRDQQKPSASVILTLQRGRSIDEGQVSAITHLISSSVPELNAKNVTVVDQAGNLLSSPNTNNRGLDASQLKYTHEIEQNYIRRIEAILQPIVGSGNVKAQVTADVDFTTVEKTDEKYGPNQDPNQAAVRSMQSSDSNQQGVTPPGGVPGALSNQAPNAPTAQINAPPAGATANNAQVARGPSNTRRDATTNYEVDKSIRHTQQGAGGVKRLSVAVVVNYRNAVDAKGKPTTQAIPAAELDQIKNLTREAMGFSTERGDSLNVANSQFVTNENLEPELPWWKQRDNIALGKTLGQYLLFAVIFAWLWFSVLRPLLRKHLEPPVAASTPTPAIPAVEEIKPNNVQLSAEAQERREQRLHENMQHAQTIIEQDPRLAAMVIKNWINGDKEQQ
ncbi:flagellar basal-body MS-ring/collar protein FliF [Glaciimonas soli]|uniref:Flagellar M-ring protein n=1 Tax=Glaciimonas soli TaxID=2590999 RepID=A0A843YPG7_9BURK|nr:flagellar basal-body MS-ring/collar protein FliF [Glaciimonas soli]MQQ99442.1 flagellar basal body M-ring protein FliF [Glaciimonas soli]